MPKSVRRLCRVLTDRIRWRVAVVAGRDVLMAGFLPAIELFVHHMAVGTSDGIVAHV